MYFATGFEIPLTELVLEGFTAGSATISAAQSHKDLSGNGGSSSLVNNNSTFALPASGDQNEKKWVSFAFRPDVMVSLNITILNSLGAVNASIRVGNTGSATSDLTIFRGNFLTSLATTASPFVQGVWYWIDLEIKITDSLGIISVYVNGNLTPTLTYSGDTKQDSASDGFNKISFHSLSGTSYYDDIIVSSEADGRPAYECFIKKISPNAAGSHTGLTPSAGSNYQCVDETTPSDVDYNEGTAADAYDLYNFTSLGYNPIGIKGVVLHTRAAKDGIITRARAKCLSNGSGEDGSYVTLGSSYLTSQHIFPLNPDGSVAWTETTINAAEFGIQFDEAT